MFNITSVVIKNRLYNCTSDMLIKLLGEKDLIKMELLNLPEGTTVYIIGFFTFMLLILVAIFTFWWLKRLSKKELEFMEKSPEQYISNKLYSKPNVNEKKDKDNQI